MFVASAPNLALGRGTYSTNQIKVAGDRSGLHAFYFGRWPFDGLDRSPSTLNTDFSTTPPTYKTFHFSVNAAGAANTSSASFLNKMISDNTAAAAPNPGGGIYNVIVDKKSYPRIVNNPSAPPTTITIYEPGVTIHNSDQLH